MDQAIEFTGTILKADGPSGGAYVEFPFDVAEAFGKTGRIKVVCRFDGIEYRGSLVRMGAGRHIVGILKDILAVLGKAPGDSVAVSLAEDAAERVVAPHPELAAFLSDDPVAQTAWESLSYTRRKQLNDGLATAKQDATRSARLEKIKGELGG